MPDLNEAIARLDAAESAETPPAKESFVQEQVDPNAATQPTPEQTPGTDQPSNLTDADTQAAAELKPTPDKVENAPVDETPKPGDKPADKAPDKSSPFAKDKARRDESWKKLNEEKTAIQKERDAIKAERDYIAREKQQIEEARAKASAKFTPEEYEASAKEKAEVANTLELQADGLEKRAEALENADRYDEAKQMRAKAQELREDSAFQKGAAKRLAEMAKHTRENPDPTLQQIQQRNQQKVRDYTMEAAKKWPDMAKEGSTFQKTVVGHLQAARAAGLQVNENPVLIYHAARLTAAETAAACVPALNKELGELRAKVKELEAFTSPGGGLTSAQQLGHDRPASEEEEGAALRGVAVSIS
jgi:myosin heavy subunit